MADKPQNKNLFPGLSYILNSNTMMLNQRNGNPSHFNSDHTAVSSVNSPSDAAIDRGLRKPNNWREIVIMGALKSGICTAIAPIERVYSLMQCQNELLKTGRLSRPYKGMTDCFRRTIKYQGFFSLWRGNSVNLFNVCTTQGFVLVNSKLPQNDHNNDPPAGAQFAALLMLGTFINYPIWYAHVRLLNDATDATGRRYSLDLSSKTRITYAANRLFSGGFDVVTKTLASDGIRGLYRGCTIASLGLYVYYLAECAAKDVVSKYSADKQNQKKQTILPGIASGFFTLSIPALVYPVGTVYKRMMMRSGEANKYKGSMDALTQIVRKEGVGALYKGLAPNLICHVARASICSALLYSLAKLGIPISRDDFKF